MLESIVGGKPLQPILTPGLGDSTQNFKVVDALVICQCREMSNQNGSFNTCAEMCKRVDFVHAVHNDAR